MRNFFLFFSFFALNFIGITPYEFSIVFISSFFILFFIFFFLKISTQSLFMNAIVELKVKSF